MIEKQIAELRKIEQELYALAESFNEPVTNQDEQIKKAIERFEYITSKCKSVSNVLSKEKNKKYKNIIKLVRLITDVCRDFAENIKAAI